MYIEFRAEDTQVDELKVPATCAWAVSQVGNTMDKAGLWFSESEAAQMVQCGLLYVQCHVWLAREALLAARPSLQSAAAAALLLMRSDHEDPCGVQAESKNLQLVGAMSRT